MKISSVNAILTEDDLMSILKDYVKVEGLCFKSVKIGEFISIQGEYKKIIKIPFEAILGVGSIKDNILNIKIFSIKISKLGVVSPIKNFALRKVLIDFKKYGVNADKDNISIDLSEISKFIPYISFKLNNIVLNYGSIHIEADNITYDENKNISYEEEETKVFVEDSYCEFREGIIDSVPDKYKDLAEYTMLVPDIIALLWRLFRDKRIPTKAKGKVAAIIGYLAMPFDIIPDFIPFIGKIDDVAIAFYGLNAIINEVPKEIVMENWQGDQDIIIVVQRGIKYISTVLGSENVGKLLKFIKNIFTKNKFKTKEIKVDNKNCKEKNNSNKNKKTKMTRSKDKHIYHKKNNNLY